MVFLCQIEGCGKQFSCKKTLKEHQRTHTGERPYICNECDQTFAQYSSMQKHQRVHDKKRPYVCTFTDCNQAFSQISNLIRHQRIHTGEKPYICNVCKKKFASGSNLKQHIQVHDNDETRVQYKCYVAECGKGYLYISSLKKHIQVSHPEQYETDIKTQKIDLNDCKEVIQDILNHQYHDEEEEISEGLETLPQNEPEQDLSALKNSHQIKSSEKHSQVSILGKRKYQDEYGHIQQIPQRRKIRQNNSKEENDDCIQEESNSNSISALLSNKIQPALDYRNQQSNEHSKIKDFEENKFDQVMHSKQKNILQNQQSKNNVDYKQDQAVNPRLMQLKKENENFISRVSSPVLIASNEFSKFLSQAQQADIKGMGQDQQQLQIKPIKKPIIQIQSNQNPQNQGPSQSQNQNQQQQDLQQQLNQIRQASSLILPQIVQQNQAQQEKVPSLQLIVNQQVAKTEPPPNPAFLLKKITPDYLLSPSNQISKAVERPKEQKTLQSSMNSQPSQQQSFQPFGLNQQYQNQMNLLQQPQFDPSIQLLNTQISQLQQSQAAQARYVQNSQIQNYQPQIQMQSQYQTTQPQLSQQQQQYQLLQQLQQPQQQQFQQFQLPQSLQNNSIMSQISQFGGINNNQQVQMQPDLQSRAKNFHQNDSNTNEQLQFPSPGQKKNEKTLKKSDEQILKDQNQTNRYNDQRQNINESDLNEGRPADVQMNENQIEIKSQSLKELDFQNEAPESRPPSLSNPVQLDIQSHLINEMSNIASKLQLSSSAPEQISAFQQILNDFAMKATNLAMQFNKQIEMLNNSNISSIKDEQSLLSLNEGLGRLDSAKSTNENFIPMSGLKSKNTQDLGKQQILREDNNQLDQKQIIQANVSYGPILQQSKQPLSNEEIDYISGKSGIVSGQQSSSHEQKDSATESQNSGSKRFKYQSKPLKLNKNTKIEEQIQVSNLNQAKQVKPSQFQRSQNTQLDEDFDTSKTSSFVLQGEKQVNINDIFQNQQILDQQQQQLLQQVKTPLQFQGKQPHQNPEDAQMSNSWFINQSPSATLQNDFLNQQVPQFLQNQRQTQQQQKGTCSDNKQEDCCGGTCSSNTQQEPQFTSSNLLRLAKINRNQTQKSEGCCSGNKSNQSQTQNQESQQSCACSSDSGNQVNQDWLIGQNKRQYQPFNEEEDQAILEQMNRDGPDGDGFKEPHPIFNKTQQQLMSKNKDSTLILFSKLPCIKTCMSKITFNLDAQQKIPSEAQPKTQGRGAGINFETVEDDFENQSASQFGTASCKHVCDAQKLCPELLPANCDDYFEKRCNCTVYCKKTLKFIQRFVKDETQVAEIEDLCNIQDQISLMVSQNGIKL